MSSIFIDGAFRSFKVLIVIRVCLFLIRNISILAYDFVRTLSLFFAVVLPQILLLFNFFYFFSNMLDIVVSRKRLWDFVLSLAERVTSAVTCQLKGLLNIGCFGESQRTSRQQFKHGGSLTVDTFLIHLQFTLTLLEKLKNIPVSTVLYSCKIDSVLCFFFSWLI